MPNKKLRENKKEMNRQKHMMRLVQRYASLIHMPGLFSLPFVYDVRYYDADTREEGIKEFVCYTNNLAFAIMIFEAQMLPKQIAILSVTINTAIV
jgi:hypothetical protein